MKRSSFALFLVAAAFIFVPAAHAQQSPPPTCTLSASAGVVQKGGTVNLRWQSSNAVSGTITSIGSVGPSGIQGVIPTQTTEYVGVFAGAGGTARCSVTVIVTLPTGGTTVPGANTQPQPGVEQDAEFSSTPGTFPTVPGVSAGEPVLTSETGGLVPCTGLNCQACHLASLVQNIIKFLIMLAIPLAALLFAVAGAMYFSSEISHKKEQAKAIIKKGIIGFIITLSAYLVVNTVFYILFEPPAGGGSWFTLRCVSDAQRPQSGTLGPTINALIGGAVPSRFIPVSTPTGGVGGSAEVYCDEEGNCYQGGQPYTPSALSTPGSPTNPISTTGALQWSGLVSNACAQHSLTDCTAITHAVMAVESRGRANAISPAGAVGLMQIMPGTACALGGSSVSGCSGSQIADKASVVAYLQNPTNNVNLGVQYLSQLQSQTNSFDNMIAAYNGGIGATLPSRDCGAGTTRWACPINPGGYTETQKYVPLVKSTYNSLLQ